MNVLCCVKQVPDTQAAKRLDGATFRLDREAAEGLLNPFDEYSVEEGLRIAEASGGTVTLLCMGPARADAALRRALAMGAERAVHVCDPAVVGSDTLATARVLAAAVKALAIPFDLILFAAQTTDAGTGQVPAMVSELLDLPALTYAKKVLVGDGSISIHRESDAGYSVVSARLPALVSVTKAVNTPRYPSLKGIMAAKKKEVRVVDLAAIGLAASDVGEAGSRTAVTSLSTPPPRAAGQVVKADGNGHLLVADFLQSRNFV